MQSIDIIPWDDNFCTGLTTVDQQHRRLVDLLNQVATELAYSVDEIDLNALFKELIAYTELHFEAEEAIWQRVFGSDPVVQAHSEEHAGFFERVQQMIAGSPGQSKAEVAEEVLGFLTQWLIAHVLASDRHLAYVVNALSDGATMEEAKASAVLQMAEFRHRTFAIVMSVYGHLSRNTLALMRELAHHRTLHAALRTSHAQLAHANEQQQIAQARADQEHRLLASVFDAIPELVWLRGPDGTHLACNTAYAALGNTTPDALLGHAGAGVFAPALEQQLLELEQQAHVGDVPLSDVLNVVQPTGQPDQYDVLCQPVRDEAGELLGMLGVAHNVSEHRLLERRLAEACDHAQRYLDTVQVIIVSLDASGTIKMLNRKGYALLGYEPDTLLGKNWFDTCLPQSEGREDVYRVFLQVMSGHLEGVEHIDNEIITRTGERRLIAWHNVYVRQPDGTTTTLSTGEDITDRRRLGLQVDEERRRLANIIWGTDVGTWEWNVRTGEIRINERWAEIIGYTLAELAPLNSDTWLQFVHPDDKDASRDAMDRYLSGERVSFEVEARLRHRDGHWVWTLDRGKVVEWTEDGTPLWMSGTHADISAKKAVEGRLEQAASVFEYAQEGIMITDADERIIDVNRAFTAITGYERDEVLGQTPRTFSSGRHDSTFYKRMWAQLMAEGTWAGEVWNRRKNGEIYAERLTISAIRQSDGTLRGYAALFSDVTEHKRYESQLEHMAHFDQLTGLPNRNLLSDRLRLTVARAQRNNTTLAVAYLDLDGFKQINDEHGHSAGDHLLIEVSKRMQAALRGSDTLSRVGGDEFIAVLPDLKDPADCLPAVQRLLNAAATAVQLESRRLHVSASIGVTFWQGDPEVDAEQLLRQADQAMYLVKQSGKNGYRVFDAEQERSLRGQHRELVRIADALHRGQLRLHYQPKVHLRTGEVVGLEALIRWQCPERGLLSPAHFLPQVEGHPLSAEIGNWVINAALEQLSVWHADGYPLSVSVNIAGDHLQRPDFTSALRAALARHSNVPPEHLELEILETSALEDLAQIAQVLRDCCALGVSCALDDFGTGHSSLTYLKRLPAQLIKIDQSFVRDMLVDPDDLAILDGVLGLAKAFGRDVIAEGVEEEAQGVMLLRLGCVLAQGYAIARPMPPEDIPEWSRTWRPPAAWQRCHPLHRDYHRLLFATTEHAGWLAELAELLGNGGAPAGFENRCQLKAFFEASTDQAPDLQVLRLQHDALHAEVSRLLFAKAQGAVALTLQTLHTRMKGFLIATEAVLAIRSAAPA